RIALEGAGGGEGAGVHTLRLPPYDASADTGRGDRLAGATVREARDRRLVRRVCQGVLIRPRSQGGKGAGHPQSSVQRRANTEPKHHR
ncbi:hypothetical protein, partial [Streptomyces sp. WELS2]|uniref:hypothetical protein n=1 Tax=Streptomyces sp. WELS2 TaxID=2749435 RepID=UPI001C688F9D